MLDHSAGAISTIRENECQCLGYSTSHHYFCLSKRNVGGPGVPAHASQNRARAGGERGRAARAARASSKAYT